MSNSRGGWRAYRPSRGKHKLGNAAVPAMGGGGGSSHPTVSKESNENADPRLPSARPAPPTNAWAAGPPVAKSRMLFPTSGGGGAAIVAVTAGNSAGSRNGGAGDLRQGDGGGRGRGRGAAVGPVRGRGGRPPPSSHDRRSPYLSDATETTTTQLRTGGEVRFADAADQHQAAIKRHLLDIYVSSSEEEEDDDEEEGEEDDATTAVGGGTRGGKSQQILNSVLENFSQAAGRARAGSEGEEGDAEGGGAAMRRTYQMLTACLGGGGIVCLICISGVKKADAVWTCQASCFSMFHLVCIQKWVNEGAYQQAATATLSAQAFPARDIPWQCPKCRFDYPKAQCPTRYFCYCGKERDPKFSPWNLPHSCGGWER